MYFMSFINIAIITKPIKIFQSKKFSSTLTFPINILKSKYKIIT